MNVPQHSPIGTIDAFGRQLIEKRITGATVDAVVAQIDDADFVQMLREHDFREQRRTAVYAVLQALGKANCEPFLLQFGIPTERQGRP